MGKIALIKEDLARLMTGEGPAVQWDQTTISQAVCRGLPVEGPPPNATPEERAEVDAQREFLSQLPELPPPPSGEAPRKRLALVRETLCLMTLAAGDVTRETSISKKVCVKDEPVGDEEVDELLAEGEAKLAALSPMTRLWG